MAVTSTEVGAPPGARRNRGGLIVLALSIGFVMANLDMTVVNVANASIGKSLSMGLSGVTWVVDGYILTYAALLLLAGSLATKYGAKKVYLVGLALFIVASLGCGIAPSGAVLVVARLVQGVGAALFMPGSLVLLVGSFPDPAVRSRMVGLWSAAGASAAGLGPVVGGLLVDLLGWRSVFWLNLPVGVIGFLLSVRALAAAPAKPSARIEPFGHMLGVIGLAGLAFTVIEGPALHWSSPVIIVSAVITVLAIVAFVVRERRVAEPMFPVQLFHNSRFTAANLINFLLCFGLYGIIFLLGLFFQQVRGADPMHGGLQMLPMMLVFVIGNLGFARVVPKTGTRVPMMVGLLLAGVVSVVLLWVSPTTPYWLLATAIAVGNLGLGVAAPASTAAMMDTVGQANAGIGGSTLNANKQVGALVGVAVMGAVLASGGGNWYSAARIDFGLSVLAYLVAGVIAARAFRGTR